MRGVRQDRALTEAVSGAIRYQTLASLTEQEPITALVCAGNITADVPALTKTSASKAIRDSLNALHAARTSFIAFKNDTNPKSS